VSTANAQIRPLLRAVSFDYGNIPFPVFTARRDDEIVSFNQHFVEYMRIDPGARIGIPITDLEARFNCELKSAIKGVMDTGKSVNINDVVIHVESDEDRYASIHLMPSFPNDGGTVTSCIGLIHDVSGLRRLGQSLNLVQNELSIVSQVSAQLGSIMETEEIFKIILIAVTAREGLGFNRAFILLLNEEQTELVGHRAIGPVDAEEAGKIWQSIPDEGKDLKTIIRSYRGSINLDDMQIDRAVRNLRYPMNGRGEALADSIINRKSQKITSKHELSTLAEQTDHLFGESELAVAPLFSMNTVHGIIVADNRITNKQIAGSDLEQLQMFASQAAIAVERARLYENLQSNIEKLEGTNRQLERTQQEVIKMEKLSLMGEMTYRVTHELRNPLTIIGGFASLLLKSEGVSGTARERAEIIKKECTRIERQLDVLLDFSRSYSQEKEDVDLNRLIKIVAGMVQPKFLSSGVVVESKSDDTAITIHAHKDQLLHGLYNTVAILGELSPNNAIWTLSAADDSGTKTIDISPDIGRLGRDQAVSIIHKFVQGRGATGDLRLSLANEAIAYNGGELGFALDDSQPKIYVTFES
jgi:signal transduction histidine kinase